MRAIWQHTLDDYQLTLTASSEATNFGKELVLNPLLFKTWRSTGIATEWLKFDAGAGNTFTFDSCFISNHNFSNTATIKFQMHGTDSWSSPDLNETLTWRSGHIIKFFTSTSKRYCRFYFEDAANTNSYIQIGRLSASQYLQFTPSSLIEFSIQNNRNDIVNITPSQNVYSYLLGNYRTFEYSFPPSSTTMIQKIRTMYDAIGNGEPLLLMNFDTTYTTIEPCYCVIEGNITENWNGAKASYDLTLREVGGY